jgi:hypothetical protein
MSRSLWRCRNPECPVPHGAVLGRITADEGLVLSPAIRSLRCFLDTRKVVLECPACGVEREFRGKFFRLQSKKVEHSTRAVPEAGWERSERQP